MGNLEINHVWTSTGSSGAVGTPVEVKWPTMENVVTVQFSTLASTQSWSVQLAQDSTGPWFTQASTSISTGISDQIALRWTGPWIGWARVYLNSASTGTYQFRFMGLS